MWDIPPVWVEQLADGGRIVGKLRMWGLTRSLSLGRDGNCLISWLAMLCGFVAMLGTGAGAATAARRPPRRGGRPQARRCGPSAAPESSGDLVLPTAASLPDVLRWRRSQYAFARQPLEVAVIGSFLGDALGASRPTATGIAPGVYRYRMSTHTLRTVSDAAPEGLAQAYEQPEFAERAAASLLLTVELGRAVTRYGARHYRVRLCRGAASRRCLPALLFPIGWRR